MSILEITAPHKLKKLYESKKRYILIVGGRGSAKSWGVSEFLIIKAAFEKKRVLCTREIQNSIKDSVHKLLKDTIIRHNLESYFSIQEKNIYSVANSEFIFKGLWNNSQGIKSTEGIDYCWIEEGQSVSSVSLETLFPTIRNKDSQIIITFNPTNDNDPVYRDLYLPALNGEREDVEIIEMNWSDNPFFPDVLKDELEWDKKTDYDKYLHKWEGKCIAHSEAQIFFNKWESLEFESPEKSEYIYGADWGFSKDPTALIRAFIKDSNLYIDYEACGIGIDLDLHPALFDSVPGSRKNKIVADSARPETIDFMNTRGFYVVAAKKGKGSVEDGIERLKSFNKIYIHPRCKYTIDEFRFYCYKTDKHTGTISNIPEDKNNHIIDALRYATEDIVTGQYRIRRTGVYV